MKRLVLILVALLWTLPARAGLDIQEVTSPGGLTAWLVEEPALPFLSLEIRFAGGTAMDAPGKRGATNMMAALIEEGAGDLDARAFATARDGLAASLSFEAGQDSFAVSAKWLTENAEAASDLLRLALTAPRFDPDAIERVRAQVLAGLRARKTDPQDILGETFARLAFGDHPYGSHDGGTEDSVTALTRDDLLAAFHTAMARDRVYIAAVGDISAKDLGLLLDKLLGHLPETGPALPERVDFALPRGGVTVVDFDTPQSVARFAQPGMSRHDPDFFAAYIVTQVLGGGGFSSRLMDEVREKRGLTYGIGAYMIDKALSEYLVGSVASQNDTMGEVIDVVRAEWARLAEQGITAEELAAAQTYLTGAYPLRFDGNERIANILVMMQRDGYGLDYIATRNDRVRAVTLEDANRVARALYDPEGLHFVVVGRPEGVE